MIYSTAESLCGEFFAAFTENAADLTPSDFERFNKEFKKRFTTGVRYGRSSDKQVLTAEQKSYCREALYACLTFIQCVRWVRVGSPKVFDEGELVREYPSFGSSADEKELSELLRFRNFAKAFLSLIPAGKEASCKGKILHIAGKLSANKIYSTGKGQSGETSRRVQIYEREAKVVKKVSKRFTKNDPSVCAAKVVKKVNTQTHRLVKPKKVRSGSIPSVLKKRSSSSEVAAAGVAGPFGSYMDRVAADEVSVTSGLSAGSENSVAKRPRFSSVPYSDSASSDGTTTCASGFSEDSDENDAASVASADLSMPDDATDDGYNEESKFFAAPGTFDLDQENHDFQDSDELTVLLDGEYSDLDSFDPLEQIVS
mmetsp:Transcript_62513/g.110288  ORF Transcript_62513/g.110288 Transcript_62513/m.110288 type:complete len:370 (-) Transcript_62513:342-1451(-)